jgi:hypothetical protein
MSTPALATKLYVPLPRPKVVLRPRLIARLTEGLHRKLTLISAPAGFGKTTLAGSMARQQANAIVAARQPAAPPQAAVGGPTWAMHPGADVDADFNIVQ